MRLLPLLLAGCALFPDHDPASSVAAAVDYRIDRPRVLAVRTDPIQAGEGEEVRVEVLARGPDGVPPVVVEVCDPGDDALVALSPTCFQYPGYARRLFEGATGTLRLPTYDDPRLAPCRDPDHLYVPGRCRRPQTPERRVRCCPEQVDRWVPCKRAGGTAPIAQTGVATPVHRGHGRTTANQPTIARSHELVRVSRGGPCPLRRCRRTSEASSLNLQAWQRDGAGSGAAAVLTRGRTP